MYIVQSILFYLLLQDLKVEKSKVLSARWKISQARRDKRNPGPKKNRGKSTS